MTTRPATGLSATPAKRWRIGLLFDSLWDDYEAKIWHGVVDETRAQDVSLLNFAGGALNSPMRQHRVREVIHDLIGRHNIDGLLVISGCVGAFLTPQEMRQYLARFSDLPMISLSGQFDDIPNILVDNRSGMYDLVSHLIEVHHRQQIAFITGPENNFDSEERFLAYKKALTDHEILVDPRLIIQGNFLHGVGERAALTLINERRVKFDAIVGANDNMALGAMRMLRRLGVNTPEQVSVGGFDDSRGARSVMPTLTTVRQPTYEIGRRAVRDMIAWLNTGQPPQSSSLPTRLVVRGSCGCLQGVHKHHPDALGIPEVTGPNTLDDAIPMMVAKLSRHFITMTDILGNTTWAQTLIDAYLTEHRGTDSALRSALQTLMAESEPKPVEPSVWAEVLHFMFGMLDPYVPSNRELRDSSLLLANQYTEVRRSGLWIEYEYQTEVLQRFMQPVTTAFEMRELGQLVKETLPQIGISGFSLSLYDRSTAQPRELSQLTLQLDTRAPGDIVVQTFSTTDAIRFQTHDLVPGGLDKRGAPYQINVYPLSFENDHFGFALFEIGNLSANIYEIANSHLISLIKSVRLLEETKNYTEKLERDVTVRTTELRLANDMLQKANSLMHNKNLEIEKLNGELLQKSKLDNLTHLYNRRAALDLLRAELNRTRRSRQRGGGGAHPRGETYRNLSVMMFDLDHFKNINDTYGHLVGDQVLKYVGELLHETGVLRQEDICGRFGGEEFIVILPDTGSQNAELPARRFSECLKQKVFRDNRGEPFSVTLSIGISEFHDEDVTEEHLIHRADQALYFAKNHGRNQIVIYEQLPKAETEKLKLAMSPG